MVAFLISTSSPPATEHTLSKVQIMLEWQRFDARVERFACHEVVQHAIEKLGADSSLCRYMARRYAFMKLTDPNYSCEPFFRTLSSDFDGQILHTALKRLTKLPTETPYTNWCAYHDHKTAQEREECEMSRESDADLVEKRRQTKRK